jgi:hypothetical protein
VISKTRTIGAILSTEAIVVLVLSIEPHLKLTFAAEIVRDASSAAEHAVETTNNLAI